MPKPVFSSKASEAHAKQIADCKERIIAYTALHAACKAHEGKQGGKRLAASAMESLKAQGGNPDKWNVYHSKDKFFAYLVMYSPTRQRHDVSFGMDNNTVTPDMVKRAAEWAESARKGLADLQGATSTLGAKSEEFRALLVAFMDAKKAVSDFDLPHAAKNAILEEMKLSRNDVF